MIIIFGIMIATSFMWWMFDGINSYDYDISSEYYENAGNVNKTLNEMETKSKDFENKVKSISETPATAIFFIPSAIISMLQTTYDFVKNFWIIMTAFTSVLGIPGYIILALDVALIFLIAYLIIEAYMRYKGI